VINVCAVITAIKQDRTASVAVFMFCCEIVAHQASAAFISGKLFSRPKREKRMLYIHSCSFASEFRVKLAIDICEYHEEGKFIVVFTVINIWYLIIIRLAFVLIWK
jgi:hypothetical protein